MENQKLTRKFVVESLVEEIKSWPFSIACWEGGSASFKRADEYSDVDLVLCVEDGKSEEAFQKIQKKLEGLAKVEHQWRVPEPTWHGLKQCFYKLEGTPEFFFFDIAVMEPKNKERFLEKERHGTPVVYFDKNNFVQSESADTPEFARKREQRLSNIESSFPFFYPLVQKEILRKRPLDAMAFYRHLTNFLIELLGMKYRPFRYDFGLRYLHNDLPPEVQKELEKFLYVSSLEELGKALPAIKKKIEGLISELKK